MRSKVRLGCVLTIPVGYEIKNEAVFSTINLVPYFELWSFVSPDLDYPLTFAFTKHRKSVKGFPVLFNVMPGI